MSNFYTSVTTFGDDILVRGYNDGESFTKKVKYSPSMYVKSLDDSSKYRTIFDDPLKSKSFYSIKEAKEWVKKQKYEKNPTFGCDKYHYQYLADVYKGQTVLADFGLIKITSMDIETTVHVTGKMPTPFNPLEEILLMTFIDATTKKKTVFGRKPYSTDDPLVTYHHISDEKEMLMEIIHFIRKSNIDIITGWNNYGFDIPYSCARIALLLGEKILSQLSPFGKVWARDGVDEWDNQTRTYTIVGISQLDYLLLYKKFNGEKQESYKLGHIGFIELGKPKLDLGVSFYEAYTNHWDKYVLYNIIDTEIVDELESKKKFIRLAVMMAHMARCSFEDTLGTVSMWECIIYNYLFDKNIIAPMSNDKSHSNIVGAVVKEPIPGFYKWVMGVDATSLYPSIMMLLNMSPETIIDDEYVNMTIPDFVNMKDHGSDKTVACNGHVFDNSSRGFMPVLVEKYFNLRVEYKNKKKIAEQKASDIKAILDDSNRVEYERYKMEADINDLFQLAIKICINSLYGACANRYFIFYDTRIAEGITMTGQAINQYAQNKINEYLNQVIGGDVKDYVVMGDTDSGAFTLEALVNKFYKDKPESELVDIISDIGKKRIEPYLNKVCDEFTKYLNGNEGKLRYKREGIAECFFGDSVVSVDGVDVEVGDIFDRYQHNDDIITPNDLFITTPIGNQKVRHIIKIKKKDTVYVFNTDFGQLRLTKDHKLPVVRDGVRIFVSADSVLMSDLLFLDKITALTTIKGISTFEVEDDFYDISLEQDDYEKQTFYLDKFEVHNCFLITGKKRYCAKVLDNEYVRYKQPKYKIVGFDCIKTTCPTVCKVDMKEAIINILNGATNIEITKFNNDFKQKFLKQKPEDISIPKGVSGVEKYINGDGFQKATPLQSRAAILFNRGIEKHGLEAEYPRIIEGNKIKYVYLKLPNPIGENVIGFNDKLPIEFGVHNYVDMELMFEKTYMSQMSSIMGAIGWVANDKGMLDF